MKKIEELLKKIFQIVVKTGLIIYMKIIFFYRVEGKENVPKHGPVIVCANHRSYLDGQFLVATCPRHLDFLVKKSLVEDSKMMRFLANAYDAIPVSRDGKDISSVKTVLKELKNDQAIGIFPEGTRNGIEKKEPIKEGTAFFAIKSKAPVVCCGIDGTLKPFHKVVIRYGKPLDLEKYTNPKSQEELKEVTKLIMEDIAQLAGIDKKMLNDVI